MILITIYCFWYSILYYTEDFINLIKSTTIDIDTWHIQKYKKNLTDYSILEIGFSTFF